MHPTVDFRFRLDTSQLPRPFQIGVVGQADWNISVERSARLPLEKRQVSTDPRAGAGGAGAAARSRAFRWAVGRRRRHDRRPSAWC